MIDSENELQILRQRMSEVNLEIMTALNRFFTISNQIGVIKDELGLPHFGPERESAMLADVLEKNQGPMPPDLMKRIFKEIFKASVEDMDISSRSRLKVNRLPGGADRVIRVKDVIIGQNRPVLIGGPCAVESYDQIRDTAVFLRDQGVRLLRGGAFKPRTSPYSFQGLEEQALVLLRQVADELDMVVVTEVLDIRSLPLLLEYADILQVGTRNMFNYSLLKELGHVSKPVLLKRGLMATIDEFVHAAEYIFAGGNQDIILCERGIRTFETQTRNTLDISCIPILKKQTPLPVIVDISHSLGRKDIVLPIAGAALAAGADGLMFEAHCNPAIALSDAEQQLAPDETRELIAYLRTRFDAV